MSDQKPEGNPDKPDDHSEASLVPHATDLVSATAADDQPQKSRPAPKEIVLQRLSPHSSWDDPSFKAGASRHEAPRESASDVPNRRALSLAAIVTIAAAVGAATGSAATFGIVHVASGNDKVTAAAAAADHGRMLESALAKVTSEIAALKAAASAQATKITKLNETTDKLKAAEATGSLSPPSQAAQAPAVSPPSRLPIVDGWVLRDVMDGIATVQGRPGIFEVFPGDPLPGLGRVDAIRRQDGRWVVVTTRGLIVAR